MTRSQESIAARASEAHDHTGESGRLLLGEPSRAFDSDVDYAVPVGRFVPAQIADEARLGSFRLRAASIQGANHRQYGEPRQDCYEFGANAAGTWLVVVVADGVSDAKYSHLGAAVAAETTRKLITDADEVTLDDVRDVPLHVERELLRQFDRSSSQVVTNLTFLAIDVVGAACYATRVGDGDVLLRWPDRRWASVFPSTDPADRAVDSSTFALPGGVGSAERVKFAVGDDLVIAVGSDGVTDPIRTAPDVVGDAFWSALQEPPPLADYVRLVGFERRACFDDRTLVTLWCGPTESPG